MPDPLLLPPAPIHIERLYSHIEMLSPYERVRLQEAAEAMLKFTAQMREVINAIADIPPLEIDWLQFQFEIVRKMQSNN